MPNQNSKRIQAFCAEKKVQTYDMFMGTEYKYRVQHLPDLKGIKKFENAANKCNPPMKVI